MDQVLKYRLKWMLQKPKTTYSGDSVYRWFYKKDNFSSNMTGMRLCQPNYGSILYEFQGNANLVQVFALDNTWGTVVKVAKSGNSVKIKLNVPATEAKKDTMEITLSPKDDGTVVENLFYVLDFHSKYVEKMIQEKESEEMQ
uniref:DUF4968 domain-containing protein n=1 Tax=Rhabditophanes sp. KR3021 TaxID=114890 RepID=A0AC35UG20_9BILA